MKIKDKIDIFNQLRQELFDKYGDFDTIEIVKDIQEDMRESEGHWYRDTDGCLESVPICLCVIESNLQDEGES